MKIDNWQQETLNALRQCGDMGAETAAYLEARRTPIGFAKQNEATSGRWTLLRAIELNPRYFSITTPVNDPAMLSLIVHETRHLQQGVITALSVYGELDAWQTGYNFYKSLTGRYAHPIHAEICALSLSLDRAVLIEARRIMQAYAGKKYRIDLLPLYPIHKEVWYWLSKPML